MIPISDTEEFIETSIKEEEQWHKQYDSSLSSLINWEYPKVCVNLQTDVR